MRRRLYAIDRLTIKGVAMRPLDIGSNGPILGTDEGHLLVHVDQPGLIETYSHEELDQLWDTNHLTYEAEYFGAQKARLRLQSDEELVSKLPADERAGILWRQGFCDWLIKLTAADPKKYPRTDAAMNAAAKEIAAIMDKMGKRPPPDPSKNKPARKKRAKPKEITEQVNVGVPSGRSLLNWSKAYEAAGFRAIALRDNRRRSGNRTPRLLPEIYNAVAKGLRYYASQECPSEADVVKLVGKLIGQLNRARRAKGILQDIVKPSDRFVLDAIKALPVFATMAQRTSYDIAEKHRPWVAGGLGTELPGQRIEIDEHELDLMSLCCWSGLWDQLTEEEREEVTRDRRKIVMAECVVTKVILAFRIVPEMGTPEAHLAALRMISEDKSRYSAAIGAKSAWDQRCGYSAVVADWGFLSDAFRTAVADFGGTVEYPGAGDSSARPNIEKLNGSVAIGPIAQLPGRTFSNSVERGEYPSEARAGTTDDDLSVALVSWAVDKYHNSPHDGLNGETPRGAWTRLVKIYGIKPSPDASTVRAVTGIELGRTITARGIRVMGNYYRTADGLLAEHYRDSNDLDVRIRVDVLNLGAISVKLPGGWIDVPCRDPKMEGVSAEWWLAATRHVREKHRHEAELVRHIVHHSMETVDRIAGRAYSRANIATHLYSVEQIEQIEAAYFFRLDYLDEDAGPDGSGTEDGFGQVIGPDTGAEPTRQPLPEPDQADSGAQRGISSEWNMKD